MGDISVVPWVRRFQKVYEPTLYTRLLRSWCLIFSSLETAGKKHLASVLEEGEPLMPKSGLSGYYIENKGSGTRHVQCLKNFSYEKSLHHGKIISIF